PTAGPWGVMSYPPFPNNCENDSDRKPCSDLAEAESSSPMLLSFPDKRWRGGQSGKPMGTDFFAALSADQESSAPDARRSRGFALQGHQLQVFLQGLQYGTHIVHRIVNVEGDAQPVELGGGDDVALSQLGSQRCGVRRSHHHHRSGAVDRSLDRDLQRAEPVHQSGTQLLDLRRHILQADVAQEVQTWSRAVDAGHCWGAHLKPARRGGGLEIFQAVLEKGALGKGTSHGGSQGLDQALSNIQERQPRRAQQV